MTKIFLSKRFTCVYDKYLTLLRDVILTLDRDKSIWKNSSEGTFLVANEYLIQTESSINYMASLLVQEKILPFIWSS